MIDLDAPILPGFGAGGITLYSNIKDVLQTVGNVFEVENLSTAYGWPETSHRGWTLYRSEGLNLWINPEGVIFQIVAHGRYRGKVFEKIGIGSTLIDVQNLLGKIEIFMDNIVVVGLPGICFEPATIVVLDDGPLIEIYVFDPKDA